jgi:hypothetical protein
MFYTACPGAGIELKNGRKYVSQTFQISHETLEANSTKTIPKFKFEGEVTSTNCCFTEPFEGYIIKRNSELQIKSVEI